MNRIFSSALRLLAAIIILSAFSPVSATAQTPASPISPERAANLAEMDRLQREIDADNRQTLWVKNYRDLGLWAVAPPMYDDKKQLVISREILQTKIEQRSMTSPHSPHSIWQP
jgi:hypothetical protein